MRNRLLLISAVLTWLASLNAFAIDVHKGLELLGGAKSATKTRDLKEVARWSELPDWVTSVAFSIDDKTLAIGLKDRVQLANVSTKVIEKTIELKSGQVRSLAYSSDGKLLAAGSYQRVALFDAATGEALRELKGHRGFVTGIAFSPDSQRLATSCEDGIARIWTLQPQPVSVELKDYNNPVTGIAWSPDGKLIATSSGEDTRPTRPGQVKIRDAATGTKKLEFELHSKAATCVAFSPDSRYLLSSSVDERINVYDLDNSKPLGFFAGHSRSTNAVIVHPDGETAISISGGRAVGKNEMIIWEFETGETLASVEAHEAKIAALAVSHNGRLAATGGLDKSAAIWNIGFLSVGIAETASNETPVKPGDSKPVSSPAVTDANVAEVQLQTTESRRKMLRAGIIGLDTSHAEAFTRTLNAMPPVPGAEGCRVIAAYPKGSPDIASSIERVPAYTEKMKELGVEIVDSIDELLLRVDVILLETNDGRPHYEQLLPCLKAGKPCFIDKPIAGSLSDAIAIFEAAKKYKVPVFSSSSLRFGKNSLAARGGSLGKIVRCETTSPAALEPSHPDLFWYGIHGVESLFTVMGTGCQSVVRSTSADAKIEVTGQWSGNRVGIYREGGGYQGTAVGESGEGPVGAYDGYDPLVFGIVKFFHTGQSPVSPEETLEIYAFMEAADESKRQNGAPVSLESVMAKARPEATKKLAELK